MSHPNSAGRHIAKFVVGFLVIAGLSAWIIRSGSHTGGLSGETAGKASTIVTGNMVHPERLIEPGVEFKNDYPGLKFRSSSEFVTSGERIFVTDPTYLADVYNSKSKEASYVREHGVIVSDFGGDSSGPVWWQPPYAMIPVSVHYPENPTPGPSITTLSEDVGTDSGSFVFLPITENIPRKIRQEIDKVLAAGSGAALELPRGRYAVLYEQWEGRKDWPASQYRNIVLKWRK